MAVYVKYCGAHTTRWSDGDKVNFQNFRRGGDLRKALSAPKGYMLAVCDLSQIGCRILNYCARQTDVVEAFADKRDVYAEGATKFFGFPINKKDHSEERRLFNAVELACGYGMGGAKFAAFCAVQDPHCIWRMGRKPTSSNPTAPPIPASTRTGMRATRCLPFSLTASGKCSGAL